MSDNFSFEIPSQIWVDINKDSLRLSSNKKELLLQKHQLKKDYTDLEAEKNLVQYERDQWKEKYHTLENLVVAKNRIDFYEEMFGSWVNLSEDEITQAVKNGVNLYVAARKKKWLRMFSEKNDVEIKILKEKLTGGPDSLSLEEFADSIAHAYHEISLLLNEGVAQSSLPFQMPSYINHYIGLSLKILNDVSISE